MTQIQRLNLHLRSGPSPRLTRAWIEQDSNKTKMKSDVPLSEVFLPPVFEAASGLSESD